MSRQVVVTVPTVLEQKLLGTPITTEHRLSRAELKTLFYVGRKLELIGSLLGPNAPKPRTVKAHRSYGYDMETKRGTSHCDFEAGYYITAISPVGNGYTEVKIHQADGTVAAHYRLI